MNTVSQDSPLLQVSHVTVQFGGLKAVDDVSFDVYPGELLGLIGPNGAGKTTVMRAIIGIVRATQGKVTLRNEDITPLPIHRRIRKGLALSQQLVRPLRQITLAENVALAAGGRLTRSPLQALLHVNQREQLDIAHQLLTLVGIQDYADRLPGTLPLGVIKRLEVARALATRPALLLLDEPLAGLNSKEAQALADTIVKVNQQGTTVILIEHNLGEVMRTCQRLVVLDNGKLIANGPPQRVMADPHVRSAYLGSEADDAPSPTEASHA